MKKPVLCTYMYGDPAAWPGLLASVLFVPAKIVQIIEGVHQLHLGQEANAGGRGKGEGGSWPILVTLNASNLGKPRNTSVYLLGLG